MPFGFIKIRLPVLGPGGPRTSRYYLYIYKVVSITDPLDHSGMIYRPSNLGITQK